MLKLAGVKKDDVVYDLGSGDGRIVITAARRYGARGRRHRHRSGRGSPKASETRAPPAWRNASASSGRTCSTPTFGTQPWSRCICSRVINQRLRPKLLAELKPGTRIVSYGFDMGDWVPERSVEVGSSTVHLWVIPRRPE